MSQIGLALPTILLYEVSIISARYIERQKRAAAGETEDKGSDGDAEGDDEETEDKSS